MLDMHRYLSPHFASGTVVHGMTLVPANIVVIVTILHSDNMAVNLHDGAL